MFSRKLETRWFVTSVVFIITYCVYLFFLRSTLLNLEKQPGELLKPEPGQIMAIGFFALIYHLAYVGIGAFSTFGRAQRIAAIFLAIIIHGGLLYGFKLWYDAIVGSFMFFFGDPQTLPWYAQEKMKFFVANGPLILYFVVVFICRLIHLGKNSTR